MIIRKIQFRKRGKLTLDRTLGDTGRVVFLKDCDNGGEIVAVFPDMVQLDGTLGCYTHVGQHGSCSVRWARGRWRVPATAGEIAALYRELVYEIGYTLKIVGKSAIPKAA